MWIDSHYGSEPQISRDVGNANRRSSLEAADLEIPSVCWRESGSCHYEARLAFREITRGRRDSAPTLIDDLLDVVEVADWSELQQKIAAPVFADGAGSACAAVE